MDYVTLIDLAISLGQLLISKLASTGKTPTEVLEAVQASVDALAAHRNDAVTKANLEAQRG